MVISADRSIYFSKRQLFEYKSTVAMNKKAFMSDKLHKANSEAGVINKTADSCLFIPIGDMFVWKYFATFIN